MANPLFPIGELYPYSTAELTLLHRTEDQTDLSQVIEDKQIPMITHVCAPLVDPSAEMFLMLRNDINLEKSHTNNQTSPHQTCDYEFLTVEDVARLLRSTVDTIRRIPKEDLPVYRGPGRPNLYLRDDLKIFLRQRRINAPISSSLIDDVLK